MDKVHVIIPARLQETQKAIKVIYAHFENEAEFAIVWLPKSQTEILDGMYHIPIWLKNKIAKTAKRYIARRVTMPTRDQSYAYGFHNTGFFTSNGIQINKGDRRKVSHKNKGET